MARAARTTPRYRARAAVTACPSRLRNVAGHDAKVVDNSDLGDDESVVLDPFAGTAAFSLASIDHELSRVEQVVLELDPDGSRTAEVLRDTLDQLLDGRRTGRWDYNHLHKTEKTHMGTLVEINLHREFDFADGIVTDYQIAGIDVDCKFSQRIGGWEIGPEIVGHLCLVVWASDVESRWRAGLVRARNDLLRDSQNRDAKRRLTPAGVESVRWLWKDHGVLAVNLLLHLDADTRDAIMTATGAYNRPGGQARLFELCRRVQGVILRRAVVETVGWGLDDPLKRMRSNGGARDALRPEGILVLGHQDNDPYVAKALGLPPPHKGEFVAARVVPRSGDDRKFATIEGADWVVARPEDPVVAAPVVPR